MTTSNPLPVRLTDLIGGRKVESDRVECKEGWNPPAILRTVCAFANDFHNYGGGYLLVGVGQDVGKLVEASLESVDLPPVDRAFAVAGTPSSLAAIDLELEPYDPRAVEGHRLPLRTVQWGLSRLASMPLEDRKQVPGLHPDRAQAIVAGVVILIEIMRNFDLLEVEVSEHDILYGCAMTAAAAAG